MSRGPLRRAQVVAPFGVGALSVVPNGTSLITAGLDYWFQRDDGSCDPDDIDLDEFKVEEWRLQEALRVNHLRLPPDYRTQRFGDSNVRNVKLTVPFLRFPRWHFCPRCKTLDELPLSYRGRKRCSTCERSGKKAPMLAQVPFVAICEYGHLQDFPFREWVHRSIISGCTRDLRLRSTGGASLSAQVVECDCGVKPRNLAQITEAAAVGAENYPTTYLSSNLESGSQYLCRGAEPWNAKTQTSCKLPIRGSLRAASNLYYALVKSSIYLPRGGGADPKLIEILSQPPVSTIVHTLRSVGVEPTGAQLKANDQYGYLLQPYSEDEIARAIAGIAPPSAAPKAPDDALDELEDETVFRQPEYEALRVAQDTGELKSMVPGMSAYDPSISKYFDRLVLVEKLRETRALWGFNRIYPEGGNGLRDRRQLLWRREPDWVSNWLPCYIVRGEGIYLELESERLAEWELRPTVRARLATMRAKYGAMQGARGLRDRDLTPRFVLLHTFAHVLMNQLTYECGYSSAALRERLFVAHGDFNMAGVLIYTAAGDAEGTLGGLVRMGKPGYLEPALLSALDQAGWCSADPVCMEIGASGQGPDSCNMAACHSCALVPETACEEFNRFLDRALLIGSPEDPGLAFFTMDT